MLNNNKFITFSAAFLVCTLILTGVSCASAKSSGTESRSESESKNESGGVLSLDDAIIAAVKQIENELPKNTAVAVLNIKTGSESAADFIIDELTGALVNGKKLVVTERRNLELHRKEMNLQLSGDVSDETLQAIGKMVGVEYIISGTLTDLGKTYRLRVQAVNVSTAKIETQYSVTVAANDQIAYLAAQDKAEEEKDDHINPFPVAREPTVKKGSVYKVGDWGPAGGIVFYDKGNDSDGWRYLEAAPKELEHKRVFYTKQFRMYIKKKSDWEAYNKITAEAGTAVGTGKSNTQKLVDLFIKTDSNFKDKNNPDDYYYAAAYCRGIDYDGFNDWYLPSIDEAELMEKNLWKNGLGEFVSFGNYWSSSTTGVDEEEGTEVWVYDFFANMAKKRLVEGVGDLLSFYVRPIRSFK